MLGHRVTSSILDHSVLSLTMVGRSLATLFSRVQNCSGLLNQTHIGCKTTMEPEMTEKKTKGLIATPFKSAEVSGGRRRNCLRKNTFLVDGAHQMELWLNDQAVPLFMVHVDR